MLTFAIGLYSVLSDLSLFFFLPPVFLDGALPAVFAVDFLFVVLFAIFFSEYRSQAISLHTNDGDHGNADASFHFCNNIVKVLRDMVRSYHLAEIVTADKSVKLLVVALTASLFELNFHLLLFNKQFLNVGYQRKCSSRGIGSQPCLNIELHFALVIIIAHNLTLNRDRLVLEVNSIPPQTKYLTSSQTVVSCDVNNKFELVSFKHLKKLV